MFLFGPGKSPRLGWSVGDVSYPCSPLDLDIVRDRSGDFHGVVGAGDSGGGWLLCDPACVSGEDEGRVQVQVLASGRRSRPHRPDRRASEPWDPTDGVA